MKKKFQRVQEINLRLKAIADSMETENRDMTPAEKDEVSTLERERTFLRMQIMSSEHSTELPVATRGARLMSGLRAIVDHGGQVSIRLRAEGGEATTPGVTSTTMMTDDAKGGALIPTTTMDVVGPLREALIYDKVGIRIPTGCVGQLEWPVVEAVKATIAGEAVKVGAKKIDLSKVATVQQRISVVVEASRESLFNSAGKLESIIYELLPMAIAETVNAVVCSPVKVTENCAISGPFVGKKAVKCALTFKDLNKAKARLLAKGVTSARMCWVMTEATKAELEATPKDTGSGIMTIEDDRLCGLPVFCSESIGEGNIGLGDFTYAVCAQFGDFYLITDPYTGADSNTVRFAFNANFGTANLMPEAFELLDVKTA